MRRRGGRSAGRDRELLRPGEDGVGHRLGQLAGEGVLLARVEAAEQGPAVAEAPLTDRLTLLGMFHPSQQNTFTGKLTVPMTDAVLARAKELAAAP